MTKYRRNQEAEQYFKSFDFYLDLALNETYHEVRYFDDFLNDLEHILNEHKDELMFYTGWNYRPIKENINGRWKKYGICKYENNTKKDIPIYINFYYIDVKDDYASVNRKSDRIVISINTKNSDIDILKYSLLHEFTHVVCDYSEEKYANLDSLINSISYEENIFSLKEDDFNKIRIALYWLNKSEQDARIGATLKYVREKRNEEMNSESAIKFIKDTYFLNQLDQFETTLGEISNKFSNKLIYILGFYMQMHHYFYGKVYKDVIFKAINDDIYDRTIIKDIQDSYYHHFKEYRKKLYYYILRQKIENG